MVVLWLEKQNVTVEEILAALMKKMDVMKNEDEKARGYWGTRTVFIEKIR